VKRETVSVTLSVVVCTYNRSGLLMGALTALAEQTFDPGQYEVLVIDNNSTDDTAAVAGQLCARTNNFHYVWEGRQGLSHARNRGLKEAAGRYIAYLDDDAKACADWCERVVDVFENVNPSPAAVGGKILPWYEAIPPSWFCDDFETRTWGEQAEFLAGENGKNGFSGSNMAFPRDLLMGMVGFSAEFGMLGNSLRMGEETELFRRVWNKYPHFWYDPNICVRHYVPEKNMKVSYRMKRRFSNGLAAGRMDPSTGTFQFRARRLLDFFNIMFFRTPICIFQESKDRSTRAVKMLEKMAYLLGQFWA